MTPLCPRRIPVLPLGAEVRSTTIATVSIRRSPIGKLHYAGDLYPGASWQSVSFMDLVIVDVVTKPGGEHVVCDCLNVNKRLLWQSVIVVDRC